MGAAASVEAVVALAVIRDVYDEAGAVRILALYGMVIAIAPAVGPVIGGYLFVLAGWRANFLLLALLVALVFALASRWLPETAAQLDRNALAVRAAAARYGALLGSRRFMGNALAMSLALTGIFAFVTGAPFVLIDRFGVATQHYGFYQLVVVAAYFTGTTVANRIVGRFDTRRICAFGVGLCAAGGLVQLAVVGLAESAWSVTAATAVFAAGLGPLFAAGPVLAMAAAGAVGGGVSAATIGALEMGGGALGALAVGTLPGAGTAWPLAVTMAASGVLAVAAFWLARPQADSEPAH